MNARPLRTTAGAQRPALAAAPPPDEEGFETIADLVAELIASTELLPQDRLAAVRGRAGAGTLAQAIVDEGHAQSDGIARALARRHGLPFVDLAETRVSPEAVELIPLRTLQRVVAVPVASWATAACRGRRPREHPRDRRAARRLALSRRRLCRAAARTSSPRSRASRARPRCWRRRPRSTSSRSTMRRRRSRSTTASPTRRSSGSSTRSSCRPPATAPPTSTSRRRRTRSRCARASTACSPRPSGSRSGWPRA